MQNKLKVAALVNAQLDKVWDYYTLPDHIVKWNFADPSWHCPKAKNDLKPGGKYLARMEAKDGSAGFDFEAEYTDIQPKKEFTYNFGERVAHVLFKKVYEGTEIIISFDAEQNNPLDVQKNGWQAILNNFKKYVEAN